MASGLEAPPRAGRGNRRVSAVVRAAGGVVLRDRAEGDEVLLIHRRRYGDWTLPKGKCEPGETDEACALREVEEETGLVCVLVSEAPSTDYLDGRGRPKRVRYWVMHVVGGAERAAPPEVDEVRWVPLELAAGMLTYERDAALIAHERKR
jgi:8-oxo-dGTP diphosphatase